MKKLILAISLMFLSQNAFAAAATDPSILVKDEGVNQGYVQTVDCVGSGVSCTTSAGVWTLNGSGGVGSGSPGGNNGEGQYNSSGSFAGLPRSVFTSGGNVGLGTTLAGTATLEVAKNSTTNLFHASTVGNHGDIFTISNGGNVGIATSAPLALLDIYDPNGNEVRINGGTGSTGMSIANTGNANYQEFFEQNDAAKLFTLKNYGSARTSTSLGISRNNLAELTYSGSAMTIYTTTTSPLVMGVNSGEVFRLNSDGNIGIGDTTPDFTEEIAGTFGVSSNSSGDGDRLWVGTNVGIGTVTPGVKLDVGGFIRSTSLTASKCVKTDGTGTLISAAADCGTGGSTPGGGLGAVQRNSPVGTFAGEESILSSNGTNVGIGTTNGIFAILDTRGDHYISGNVGIGTYAYDRGTLTLKEASNDNSHGITILNNGAGGSVRWWVDASNNNRMDSGASSTNPIILNGAGAGNVGIGTALAPLNKLDIAGNVVIGTTNAGYKAAPANGLLVQGNTGIGTVNPGTALDVTGTGRFSTAINAPAISNLTSNGFVTTAGGIGTLGTDTSTYTVTGRTITIAGTTNQITSSAGAQDLSANRTWTLSTPQDIATSSNVTFNSLMATTNLGIGTSAAQNPLVVFGNVGIGTVTSSAFARTVPGALGVIIEGNVGIGTTSNQTKLAIIGNVGIGTWTAVGGNLIVNGGGNVGIGSAWPGQILDVGGAIRTTATGLTVFNGNVGIGSTNPGVILDVTGTVRVSTGTAGQAVCWKTDKSLGQCTTVVGAGGACTCS